MIVDPENEIQEFDEDDNLIENSIPTGVPSEVIELLLGRYSGAPENLDSNQDSIIDSADIDR